MKDSEKAFIDYCKGFTYSQIAKRRGVKLATVKTWSQRGKNGKKWVQLKAECTDEYGEINLHKAVDLIGAGRGNVLAPGNNENLEMNPLRKGHYPIEATDENKLYIQNILKNTLRYFNTSIPNSDYEVEQRIIQYFTDCTNNIMIPTIEGLSNCLGIRCNTLHDWRHGKRGTVRSNLCNMACDCIREFDAQLAIGGKMPQLIYMFRAKNYYGMKDQVEQTITVSNPLGDEANKDDIIARLNALPDEDEDGTE